MNFKQDIPIFIVSYNRLSYLKKLVDFLRTRNYQNVIIVDNNSTYEPLLCYLKTVSYKVEFLSDNHKHLAVWNCGKFDKILKKNYYVVTDCDVLPDNECPDDFLQHFFTILNRYPKKTKVGFSLHIDDLPDCFSEKKQVQEWEKKFWDARLEDGLFDAKIDTTFALYRPGVYPNKARWWQSIRTDVPYCAKHLPWYEDSSRTSEEDLFYKNSISFDVCAWSHFANNSDHPTDRFDQLLQAYRRQSLTIKNLYSDNIVIPKIWKRITIKRIKRGIRKIFGKK